FTAVYDPLKNVVRLSTTAQSNISNYPFLLFDVVNESGTVIKDIPVRYTSDCCEKVSFYMCGTFCNSSLINFYQSSGFEIKIGNKGLSESSDDKLVTVVSIPGSTFTSATTDTEMEELISQYINDYYPEVEIDWNPSGAPTNLGCDQTPFRITYRINGKKVYGYNSFNTQSGQELSSVENASSVSTETCSAPKGETPLCFASELLSMRNEEWRAKYNTNAPAVFGESVTINSTTVNDNTGGSDAIVQRIFNRYKKLYPKVTVENSSVITKVNFETVYDTTDIRLWIQNIHAKNYDALLFSTTGSVAPELMDGCGKFDCYKEAEVRAEWDARAEWNRKLEAELNRFKMEYDKQCLSGSGIGENLTLKYTHNEYQYTLYYYDLVGNLVATVYPEGVRLLSPTKIAQVQAFRNTNVNTSSVNDGPIYLEDQHLIAQVNKFTYNSLGEVRRSITTDQGESKFFYDNIGRLIVSQNSNQAEADNEDRIRYSFTNFDSRGRIVETGEVSVSSSYAMNDNIAKETATTGIKTYQGWLQLGEKKEVTKIYYDVPVIDQNINENFNSDYLAAKNEFTTYGKNKGLQHTRNRITAVEYYEGNPGEDLTAHQGAPSTIQLNSSMAYYYGYNEHGLAETFIQDHKDLASSAQRFKTLNYDYDLFTGFVNIVSYQPNKQDQFYSKYEYDELNRLKRTYTSQDNVIWNQESKNIFYMHGAKARIEIGKHQIQGIDLAFTIRGELKGMNSATLSSRRDIGADAASATPGDYQGHATASTGKYKTSNKYFARDAAGFSLGYFKGDYKTVGNVYGQDHFEVSLIGSAAQAASKDLYNGSITTSATAIYSTDPNDVTKIKAQTQLSTYSYDQMYRLKEVQVFRNASTNEEIISSNSWLTASLDAAKESSSYYSHIDYDMNGNITSLKRNSLLQNGSASMDNLTYTYNKSGNDLLSNRLYHVHDGVSSTARSNDYDGSQTANTNSSNAI
ncbi:MAG: hypothetical protein ACKOXB_11140, partial [Flavobacteriales bacterium]